MARTVVAPPSSIVKCLWEVFVGGFGVLFWSCVCVCVGVVVLCRCVCVCLLTCDVSLQEQAPSGLIPRGQPEVAAALGLTLVSCLCACLLLAKREVRQLD